MIYFMGGGYATLKRLNEPLEIKGAYSLETFYVLRGPKQDEKLEEMCKYSDLILIDSGAFTFMNSGTDMSVDMMDAYFEEYYAFIEKHKDNPKIIGFFELDIDRVFGVDKAMEYLDKLTQLTDKVVPVWHNTRTIDFYYHMCKNYKRVAITQALLSDVYPEQINLFVNAAHKYGAHIHLLGFARFDTLPFLNLNKDDSFDAVSYILHGAFCHTYIMSEDCKNSYFFDLHGLKDMKTGDVISVNTKYHNELQHKIREWDNSVEV